MKILHYCISVGFVGISVSLFYLAAIVSDKTVGLIATGLAFLAVGVTNAWYTWRQS